MEKIFIDSSVFFGLADQDNPAGPILQNLLSEKQSFFLTTSLVVAETISLITKRVNKFKAIEVGTMILSSSVIQQFHIDEKIQTAAWNLFKKYNDKDFDLIDATSFVVCREKNIREVFTLDRHFSQMGFKIFP